MSSNSRQQLLNGRANGRANGSAYGSIHSQDEVPPEIAVLNKQLKKAATDPKVQKYHEDALIGDKRVPTGVIAKWGNHFNDLGRIFAVKNWPALGKIGVKLITTGKRDLKTAAVLAGSMTNDSIWRAALIENGVKDKYERMLHPPLTYLGDAFKYRTVDGKFNSALHPHLGQAGAPYAKTVPSKTHPLGALPDPSDLFDRLMAREGEGRQSESGLSSMLIYHATIIIHDIFRTNDKDKNISDSSSYLDLSPLYGFTEEMQREVRDDEFKLGLLKPDTFAEDRLLRQPPGVCIMLVMYNRYHNYVATQLRRINENGRFSVPKKYKDSKLASAARHLIPVEKQDEKLIKAYDDAWREYMVNKDTTDDYRKKEKGMRDYILKCVPEDTLSTFEAEWDAVWNKLDDDLFQTARLITCGQYIQISIHDYLRALMGFHQWDTNFTLDPRLAMTEHKNVSRGLGNQVTVEFNLLYRFHCAIPRRDEKYTEDYLRDLFDKKNDATWDPKELTLEKYMELTARGKKYPPQKKAPKDQVFGLPHKPFTRDPITNLFKDEELIEELKKSMNEPINNFGPRNVPKCLKAVEILGIMQARKWEIGTLNDFRDFFGMERHASFESITKNKEVQNALRDLYEHVDKVELYPGVFCESDKDMVADPGPSDLDSALWAAIFSDAITLVRSDRFYTVDWNTNSLTSWGMKEVTPDNDNNKSSVFHRLIQRAFPKWYPYDSIRFFHPFYTAKQNAKYAMEQNYTAEYKIQKNSNGEVDFSESEPTKPEKPEYLDDFVKIRALLNDRSDTIVHPARLQLKELPRKVQDILQPQLEPPKPTPKQTKPVASPEKIVDETALMKYFTQLTQDIIKRESILMEEGEKDPKKPQKSPVYQIDITKDFAIPVVTRYIIDFLGISHLVQSDSNPNAPSENLIYQHITNCHTFLSYNADETKLQKRRKAFKSSMSFLYDLTLSGNVREANKWAVTKFFGHLWPFGRRSSNPMTALGLKVAKEVLRTEKYDSGKAAAVLLIIALDCAYNAVLAFTSILGYLVDDLYEISDKNPSCKWTEIQSVAFDDSKKSLDVIKKILIETQKESVRLPIMRKATCNTSFKDETGKEHHLKAGQVVICDLYAAGHPRGVKPPPATPPDFADLAYPSSFTDKFTDSNFDFNPKDVAICSLAAMLKLLARMKNLRRGHDTQGRLKQVKIDASIQGYANYMAPMRMTAIQRKIEKEQGDKCLDSFNEVLTPTTLSYLTPEWDELVPFPTTWKVRFEGFGVSDYSLNGYAVLHPYQVPDDDTPFYQRQGASHYGGSFGGSICKCSAAKDAATLPKGSSSAQPTSGCGIPQHGLMQA